MEDVSTDTDATNEPSKQGQKDSPKPKKKRQRVATPHPKVKKSKSKGQDLPPPLQESINHNEFHCVICMDFPSGEIWQCRNSHLLCSSCHQRLLESVNCKCPICMVKLSRDHPTRNRVAEHVLRNYVVTCSNSGCDTKVQYGNLGTHEVELCPYRKTMCKYNPIGCEWSGIAQKLKSHQKKCEMVSKTAKVILKRVIAKKQADEEKLLKREKQGNAEKRLFELLTRRSRNVTIKELNIAQDDTFDILCTVIFKAFKCSWELHLEQLPKKNQSILFSRPSGGVMHARNRDRIEEIRAQRDARRNGNGNVAVDEEKKADSDNADTSTQTDNSSRPAAASSSSSSSSSSSNQRPNFEEEERVRVGVKLRCISNLRRKIRIEFCVLAGPLLGHSIKPSFNKYVFRPNERESELYELPLSSTDAQEMLDCETTGVNLRLLMFDKNSGLDRDFAPAHRSPSDAVRDSDSSDSDMDISELSVSGDSSENDEDEFFSEDSSDSSGDYSDEDEYNVALV